MPKQLCKVYVCCYGYTVKDQGESADSVAGKKSDEVTFSFNVMCSTLIVLVRYCKGKGLI